MNRRFTVGLLSSLLAVCGVVSEARGAFMAYSESNSGDLAGLLSHDFGTLAAGDVLEISGSLRGLLKAKDPLDSFQFVAENSFTLEVFSLSLPTALGLKVLDVSNGGFDWGVFSTAGGSMTGSTGAHWIGLAPFLELGRLEYGVRVTVDPLPTPALPNPEPGTMILLGLGGLGMAGAALRRRRTSGSASV